MKIALFILSFSCAALLYLAFTQGARIAQFERIGTECRKLQDEKELLSSVHAITEWQSEPGQPPQQRVCSGNRIHSRRRNPDEEMSAWIRRAQRTR
jgi:hypothetical protein